MAGKEHTHSRENRILNIRAVSAPPEHNTPRRMNMIAKTILEQIGGRRFAAMTGSKDFIGKETFVPIYDSIHKNKFLSWKQSDRTGKSSCTAMTE